MSSLPIVIDKFTAVHIVRCKTIQRKKQGRRRVLSGGIYSTHTFTRAVRSPWETFVFLRPAVTLWWRRSIYFDTSTGPHICILGEGGLQQASNPLITSGRVSFGAISTVVWIACFYSEDAKPRTYGNTRYFALHWTPLQYTALAFFSSTTSKTFTPKRLKIGSNCRTF